MSEESLGEQIKAERKKRKWSQSRLAEKLGVTNRTVLRWEIKGEIPNNENRLALIELLGFREEDFQPKPNEQALETGSPTIELTDLKRILPQEEDFKIYSGRRIYKRYHGHVSRMTYVTVNGRPLKYFGSLKRNPEEETVFEWGYPGGGPSRLAEAILVNYLEENHPEPGEVDPRGSNALLFAPYFRAKFISNLPRHVVDDTVDDSWQISSTQIRQWFLSLEERGITRETLLIDIYGEEYYKIK
jgi:transcriptional regulator with XRE-family HTH domain